MNDWNSSEPDSPLDGYLRSHILPEDVSALFPLLRSREALQAFTTLFHGGEAAVLIRLVVLREIGARGEQPTWSPQELRAHFAYVDEVKFDTVIHRLRDNGLLAWEPETARHQVSATGRMALAAIATLLKFTEDKGAELGYIASQLAASQSMGQVSADELQHLLSRLTELEDEFDRAVLSGSEIRIRRSEQKLNSVWRWIEKGTEVMRTIANSADLDPPVHRVAQRIGQVQSRMLRRTTVFQRTLNQLERQKVHLGQSGLSSADIARWLHTLSVDDIGRLLDGAATSSTRPGFALSDIVLDIAEYELLEREREDAEDQSLPPAQDAPVTANTVTDVEDLEYLEDWLQELSSISASVSLEDKVPTENYEITSYRLSLLALLGDPESLALDGRVAELARSPLARHLSGEPAAVNRCRQPVKAPDLGIGHVGQCCAAQRHAHLQP